MDTRADIKSLDRAGLEQALGDLEQPAWRVGQVVRWLYARGVESFGEMTDLPATLRERLADAFSLSCPRIVSRQVSTDGTRKYLLELSDGVRVETVGLTGRRLTVCFSTQAGCAMGCAFCATGRAGLVRDLTPGEMADQVTVVASDFEDRVANAVAMGQGEPFANYDSVLAALRFMNAKDGAGIGARRLTVSTCGLIAGIRRFAAEPEQLTLAVSLHSAVQSTRDRLMPGVAGQPLDALAAALTDYAATGRRPTLEYALIEGVNDTDDELRALVRWCGAFPCHVNLIAVNPVDGSDARRPAGDAVGRFERGLRAAGIETSLRAERGTDIDAACGQLRQHALDSPG